MDEAIKEKIDAALEELDWADENISEIMSGFFNSPQEAMDLSKGEISDSHYISLYELLNIEEDEGE